MLLSEEMVWKQQRTHAQPKFTAKALNTQLDWISQLAAQSIDSWKKYAEAGEPIELEYEFNLLTQLLAGVWVMGRGFEKRAATVAGIYNRSAEVAKIRTQGACESQNLKSATSPGQLTLRL